MNMSQNKQKSQNRGCYISHNPFSFNPPFLINKYLPKSSIVTRFLSIYICVYIASS